VPVLHETGDLRRIEAAILTGAAAPMESAPEKPA